MFFPLGDPTLRFWRCLAMEIVVKPLATRAGDMVELRETKSGDSVCPVCGWIGPADVGWGEYHECDDAGNPIGEPYAAGSFEGCPSCDTQWGVDDVVLTNCQGDQLRRWEELRSEWLKTIEITDEIRTKLLNIGVVVDERPRRTT